MKLIHNNINLFLSYITALPIPNSYIHAIHTIFKQNFMGASMHIKLPWYVNVHLVRHISIYVNQKVFKHLTTFAYLILRSWTFAEVIIHRKCLDLTPYHRVQIHKTTIFIWLETRKIEEPWQQETTRWIIIKLSYPLRSDSVVKYQMQLFTSCMVYKCMPTTTQFSGIHHNL